MKNVKWLKSTMIVTALLYPGRAAFALPSDGIFSEKGQSQCKLDCSLATTDAESEAKSAAVAVCNPSPAHQISDWNITVKGYGRLEASANFSCEQSANSSSSMKSCDEAENPSECLGIPDCHWISKGYGVGCWSN